MKVIQVPRAVLSLSFLQYGLEAISEEGMRPKFSAQRWKKQNSTLLKFFFNRGGKVSVPGLKMESEPLASILGLSNAALHLRIEPKELLDSSLRLKRSWDI